MKKRYSKTQSLYLSRKGVLPEIVDIFGTSTETWDDLDDAGIFGSSDDEPIVESSEEEPEEETEEVIEEEVVAAEPEPAPAADPEPLDDVTDDDIDSLCGPAWGGENIARRRKARREGDSRDWTEVNITEKSDLDDDPTEYEKQIEAENIALAEEKWNEDEATKDIHSEMDKKQDSWVWMKEKKYASMFKQIEHRLEGVLGTGKFEDNRSLLIFVDRCW